MFPPAFWPRNSGHPESSQGPSDICNLYSQMLYQLSYSRLELLAPRRSFSSVGGWAGAHLECENGVGSTTLAGLEPAIFRMIQRPVKAPESRLMPYPLGHRVLV